MKAGTGEEKIENVAENGMILMFYKDHCDSDA